MKKLYTKEYLKETTEMIKHLVNDLAAWSVFNEDLYIDEISALKASLNELEEKVNE